MNQTVLASETLQPEPSVSIKGRHIFERVRVAMSQAVLENINPEMIRPMKDQPRVSFHEARLKNLAISIAEGGQIMPGIVRRIIRDPKGCMYELCDGERRWRAVLMAGVAHYRALVIDIDDEAAQYVVSVLTNFNREGHTTLELIDSIIKMKEHLGMSIAEIAQVIGLSAIYTQNLYGLRRLAPEVRDLLDPNLTKKPLSATAAIEIVTLPAAQQVELAHRIVSGSVAMRSLKREVKTIAKKLGIEVRTYMMHPSDRRRSIELRIETIHNNVEELAAMFKQTDAMPAILEWPLYKLEAQQQALVRSAQNLMASHESVDTAIKLKKKQK